MGWKKLLNKLLFPHIAIMIILIPIATAFLVYSMVFLGTKSVVAIISYVFATYTLTVWCLKIPHLIHFFKTFKKENKFARKWQNDTRFRLNISLYGTLIWNTAYAVFQLGLGFWHYTFWFYSMACYYIALAIMRFFLVCHTRRHNLGERIREELIKYRICGWVFLLMNLALSVMVFFMVYWNRTFHHHEITTIALATYTFITFTMAVINMIKYKKYNSPVYSASSSVSLVSFLCAGLILFTTVLLKKKERRLHLRLSV